MAACACLPVSLPVRVSACLSLTHREAGRQAGWPCCLSDIRTGSRLSPCHVLTVLSTEAVTTVFVVFVQATAQIPSPCAPSCRWTVFIPSQ
eukprot:COSAG02_NODE_2109_length_9808_cov_4.669379_4_plen_91_part_00